MTLYQSLIDSAAELTAFRHDLHRHPELSGQEHRTAERITETLRSFGLAPVTVGGTGVVAVVDSGVAGSSIGLRADTDALPMNDESGRDYASTTPCQAHACGHDGHTAALLGVARHLASHPPRTGRVVLIFQPAEENGEGAAAMIADGLLDRFGFDEVYAFHNMPLLPTGTAGVRTGPTLNGFRIWEVAIEGVGGHGAAFFRAIDPLQAAARLAVEISSIVGRYIDPAEPALINVGKLQAGTSHNIISATATLGGTLRALKPEVMALLYDRLERACEGVAALTGCTITCRTLATVPPCINAPEAAETAARACAAVLGAQNVIRDAPPFPFTDDFARFLEAAPGTYLFLGQESAMCHNPAYDFDDRLLPVAGSIFLNIIEEKLGLTA
jgi:amidohydrolase